MVDYELPHGRVARPADIPVVIAQIAAADRAGNIIRVSERDRAPLIVKDIREQYCHEVITAEEASVMDVPTEVHGPVLLDDERGGAADRVVAQVTRRHRQHLYREGHLG